MATFRNRSDEELIVGYGLNHRQSVKPDETVDVPEEAAAGYELNGNFVRVDVAPSADDDK